MDSALKKKFRDSVASLPKTETHLHIEGALPFEMLAGAGKIFEKPKSWEDGFKFRNFAEFDECLLSMACSWYTTAERYNAAAKEIFARMAAQNIGYVEASFASGMVEFLGIAGDEIAEAIAKAAPRGMEVRVFMGIHHNGRPKKMEKVFEDALSWKYLYGVDLHGDETVPVEPWTAPLWKAMRGAGKATKAHAGELCGAENVEYIVDTLGVKQIEHGVRAIEDLRVVSRLAQLGVRFDICPTSNVKLNVVKDYNTHPMKELRRRAIPCTLSSDDPLVFNHTLLDEYDILFGRMGFSAQECFDVIADGWRFADVPLSVREKNIGAIEAAKREFPDEKFPQKEPL